MRNAILNKIRQNRPQECVVLPENIRFDANFGNKIEKFTEVLRGIGGTVEEVNSLDISDYLDFPEAYIVVNLIENLPLGNLKMSQTAEPHELALVDVAILRGQFGVAENGSIWLDETNFGGHRALPFITQHLVIVLDKTMIVNNMHEAYARLDITKTGFGLFLAGPSKTADIEQSLVIGAHGARSLRVFLVP
jgi:L-lactate dehydrogenase complex protein LldG